MTAIRNDDRRAIDAQLGAGAHVARLRDANGATPLMAAALYGDAALVTRLLAGGADPNVGNSAGATALMWAAPDPDKMRRLLDAGADPNARSDNRRSPLSITAGIAGAVPALKLLLDYGADATPWRATDPSALREAARVGDADNFRLLLAYVGGPKNSAVPPAAFLRRTGASHAPKSRAPAPAARSRFNRRHRGPSRRLLDTIRADPPGRRRSARRGRTRLAFARRSSVVFRCSRMSASPSSARVAASPATTTAWSRWRSRPRAHTATRSTRRRRTRRHARSGRISNRGASASCRTSQSLARSTRWGTCCWASPRITIRLTPRPMRRRSF